MIPAFTKESKRQDKQLTQTENSKHCLRPKPNEKVKKHQVKTKINQMNSISK